MAQEGSYIINVLKELINVPSVNPPGNEKKIADCVRRILDDINIPAEVGLINEKRANVTGLLKGKNGGPVLVLNGHLAVTLFYCKIISS